MAPPFYLSHTTLRKLRKQQGLTQEDLAEAMGVSQAFVSRLEHGLHAEVTQGQQALLTQALRCSPDALRRKSGDEILVALAVRLLKARTSEDIATTVGFFGDALHRSFPTATGVSLFHFDTPPTGRQWLWDINTQNTAGVRLHHIGEVGLDNVEFNVLLEHHALSRPFVRSSPDVGAFAFLIDAPFKSTVVGVGYSTAIPPDEMDTTIRMLTHAAQVFDAGIVAVERRDEESPKLKKLDEVHEMVSAVYHKLQ